MKDSYQGAFRKGLFRAKNGVSYYIEYENTENFNAYYARFLESDLGKIYLAIPWDSLVTTFGIKEKASGSKMMFSPKGRITLMFLKHHAGCSDRKTYRTT